MDVVVVDGLIATAVITPCLGCGLFTTLFQIVSSSESLAPSGVIDLD